MYLQDLRVNEFQEIEVVSLRLYLERLGSVSPVHFFVETVEGEKQIITGLLRR
jgi:hypothetical protein